MAEGETDLQWVVPLFPLTVDLSSPTLAPRMRVSVAHLEGGGVLRTRSPPIVESGCADVRVAEPLLDESDIRLVL